MAAPRAVASPSAFDIAPVAGGAFLAWGQPATAGGGIRGVLLDRLGTIVRQDIRVYQPPVARGDVSAFTVAPDAVEVAIATGGGRVGVVWVGRDQTVLSLQGAVGEAQSGSFSPTRTFGPTARRVVGPRGYVALGGSPDGRFVALLRGAETTCPDPAAGACTAFSIAELSPDGFVARGVPLVVPEPCPNAVVGFASAQSRWHYGVCALEQGRPTTSVYSIQFEPEYARADRVLPGCEPDSLFSVGDEVVVSGACAGGRAGARLSRGADALRPLAMDRLALSCEGDRPVIETGRDYGMRIKLDAPMAHVEVLFPERIAPPRSRAVWTGASLLVATPRGGEVVLHRFQCEEGELRRTDVL